MKTKSLYNNNTYLLEVIHNFIKFTSSAETSQEIFSAISKNFLQMLQIEECVVYEAFVADRKLVQRATHGVINPNGEMNNKLQTLDFNEGIVGWVAENLQTVCIGNSNLDKRYLIDRGRNLSELSVPIKFNGELFGVIDSENSAENFYNLEHIQLFELIAELAATLLVRIRQKKELDILREELEILLQKKNKALNLAIETVSDQVSELKDQEEKKRILIKEVHHRVNNNLQILSSLINIYLNESKIIDKEILKEIQQKIQTLSSIHLILLKSVETNKHSIQDFLLDLIASIRYMNESNYLILHAQSWAPIFSMNTFIPLGMLINELITFSSLKFWEKGEPIELNISIIFSPDSTFILEINSVAQVVELKDHKDLEISSILIDAFVNQLDGEILKAEKELCLWKIKLNEIE